MSSDFLEDIDDDENESTVQLTMNSYGHAFLYANGENKDYYHLTPDETGWKNGEKIVSAIKEWIHHTKRIAYSETAPRHTGIVVEKENHCVLKIDDKEYKLQFWDSTSLADKKVWKYYIDKKALS